MMLADLMAIGREAWGWSLETRARLSGARVMTEAEAPALHERAMRVSRALVEAFEESQREAEGKGGAHE